MDHDRAKVIEENRIDQHFPLVTRNRPDLSYVVILPKPPPSRSSAPSEFHYIAPESEAEPPPPQHQANEDSPSSAPTPEPIQRPLTPPELHRSPKKDRSSGQYVPQKDENNLLTAIKVFSEPLIAKICFSKNVKDKIEAIESLKSQVDNYSKDAAKPGQFFKACSETLQYLLKTSIWSAFQLACSITQSLFVNVVEKFK